MAIKCPKCHFENLDDTLYCGKCATPLPVEEISAPTETLEAAKEELTTGSTFARRYQIIEELGKGGMGKVYKAQDTEIKDKVALKLLKPEIAADKKTIERFQNELRFARKISHRNVCRMYDLNKEEGTYYITMEYVPGEDLKNSIIRMGPLSAGKAIFIAKQVCEGLAEAHELGVVHRDLKPQNIMIDRKGNARIMDFGIARSITGKGITGAGVMIGTPEYMSPEQVEGKEVDQRSDIYSLGVILYEMVTGRVPFEGDTPLSIAVKHKTETPKEPRELNTQIPEELSRVILRCMEKDKEKRYQSAGEVSSELTNIEKGIPTTEREIPKRKPITSKEITVTFGLKKLFIPALVVVALVIVAVVIWQLLPRKEAVPIIPSDKPSLAVMYFKNNTGDESFDIWRTSLSDSIITDLSQSKFIRVLSGDRLYSILKKLNLLETRSYASEDLKEVAAQGNVNHILQGGLSKAGDTFRIDYTLQEISTGETIGAERVEGTGENSIFSMVDELTRRIKTNLRLSAEEIASDIDKAVGNITTSSPEAYKYYSEGSKHYRMGENRKSIPFLEKAIAIDPEFAMAYRTISAAYWNMGYRSEGLVHLKKAFELSERVSARERYRIQGDFYHTKEVYDKAIEAYEKLLELYPDDWIGNNLLGFLYINTEQWDKAIERLDVNIKNKVEAWQSYWNQADAYMAKALYDKAREVIEYFLNNIADLGGARWALAYCNMRQGKFDLANAEIDKVISLYPAVFQIYILKGDINQYTGSLIEAEKLYQKVLELKEPRAHYQGWRRLATLCLLQGRFEEAKKYIKQCISWAEKFNEMESKAWSHAYLAQLYSATRNYDLALRELEKARDTAVVSELLWYQRFNYYWRGLVNVQMKSLDKAEEAAEEFKERVEKGMNRKEIRFYYHLMGMIEIERKNFSKAIEYINKALPLHPYGPLNKPAWFLETLALAYDKSGNIDKAQEQHERIISLIEGRLWHGDVYAKSFYMLGKIYEQKGWKGKSIEHYQKFLDIWKDADPGIAEVEDARKRLATLQVM
jgi:serine/threonine protein kinase/predicted Zn-dependent protease